MKTCVLFLLISLSSHCLFAQAPAKSEIQQEEQLYNVVFDFVRNYIPKNLYTVESKAVLGMSFFPNKDTIFFSRYRSVEALEMSSDYLFAGNIDSNNRCLKWVGYDTILYKRFYVKKEFTSNSYLFKAFAPYKCGWREFTRDDWSDNLFVSFSSIIRDEQYYYCFVGLEKKYHSDYLMLCIKDNKVVKWDHFEMVW